MTNEMIENAMTQLNAIEITPGRFAFKLHRAACWQVGSAEQIVDLGGKRLEAPQMPAWWSPKHQFAWTGRHLLDDSYHIHTNGPCPHTPGACITANLETGEEQPA